MDIPTDAPDAGGMADIAGAIVAWGPDAGEAFAVALVARLIADGERHERGEALIEFTDRVVELLHEHA